MSMSSCVRRASLGVALRARAEFGAPGAACGRVVSWGSSKWNDERAKLTRPRSSLTENQSLWGIKSHLAGSKSALISHADANRATSKSHSAFRGAAVAMAATTGATLTRTSSSGAYAHAQADSETSENRDVPQSPAHKLDIVLYQYEVCPYCNKVRAFLDFHKIPYRTVEVNPLSKAEIKFSDYKKVPVVLVDGEQFNDSSVIIGKINRLLDGQGDYEMNDKEQKWNEWVDTRLIKILPPNIYRTARESFQTFEYLADASNFNVFQREAARYFGAGIMYVVSKKLKKKYDIEDERTALYEAVDSFVDAVGDDQFLGGESPNLADLSVFGVLRSIEKYDTFGDMMSHSKIGPWYERMKELVGTSSRVSEANPVWA